MSKGSGRRRITPSDGLQYNSDTDMTNIEQRGFTRDLGSSPTRQGYHGTHGERRGGRGKNSDIRNWKNHTKGKQYEHNARAREQTESHRPVSEGVASRLREKSINADIKQGFPCKAWSRAKGSVSLTSIIPAAEKFLVKFGGESYKGYATYRARPYKYRYTSSYSYTPPPSPSLWKNDNPPLMKLGFAAFEEKVQRIELHLRYALY